MSAIIDIADAVVASLNAGSFNPAFTAVRHYLPAFELAEMAFLHVSVVPRSLEITAASRSDHYFDCAIDTGVQQKVDVSDAAELDALVQLVQDLADHLRMTRLETLPDASFVRLENAPVFAPEHLDQWRQFTSVITVTYRVRR